MIHAKHMHFLCKLRVKRTGNLQFTKRNIYFLRFDMSDEGCVCFRFLERRKKLGERMMGYHLHKESMEEGHKIEKELLGKKLGLPYPPTYSDVEVLKEKQRKEREKLWEEAGAEVERMGIR
jgi:hypothetical protein